MCKYYLSSELNGSLGQVYSSCFLSPCFTLMVVISFYLKCSRGWFRVALHPERRGIHGGKICLMSNIKLSSIALLDTI